MTIEVLHDYGGQPTQGRRILPGKYDYDDPALFGLAGYLVNNGHAVYVVSETDVTPAEDVTESASVETVTENAPKRGKRK